MIYDILDQCLRRNYGNTLVNWLIGLLHKSEAIKIVTQHIIQQVTLFCTVCLVGYCMREIRRKKLFIENQFRSDAQCQKSYISLEPFPKHLSVTVIARAMQLSDLGTNKL